MSDSKRALDDFAPDLDPNQENAPKRKALTLCQQNMKKFGIEIPHVYTSEDTKHAPWTDVARKLYREKKTLHDAKQASKWMRWWFEEHKDMPEPAGAAPRSAYFLFTHTKCTELGIFNNKKELKKLGAEWKAMTDEDKAPWEEKNEEKRKEHRKEEEKHEDEMTAWRKAKKEKPKRTDDKPECKCIYCQRLIKCATARPAVAV